jgi:hypothetical protein
MLSTSSNADHDCDSAESGHPRDRRETAIVILRGLPVLQCPNCPEYQIEDQVFARVEALLAEVATTAELEVIRYAA